jgi:hypothetical protein
MIFPTVNIPIIVRIATDTVIPGIVGKVSLPLKVKLTFSPKISISARKL